MKTSSAQSESSDNESVINPQLMSFGAYSRHFYSSQSETASPEIPNFNSLTSVQTHSLRMAARLNAANITESERQELLQERQRLLDKKFSGEISPSESNKLQYVRWSLDRIEDARHGGALDILEDSVSKYENFLAEIRSLNAQVRSLSKAKR